MIHFYNDIDSWELYDLENDPYELTNLIGFESHLKVADNLSERLLKRMSEAGEPVPVVIKAEIKKSGQRIVRDSEIYM